MCQGLQAITDYKGKTSHVADSDVLLPYKLNTFFARFEDNTVPPTWSATKDCGFSFSMADVSKPFKRVNPRKAAGPDGIPSQVLRACADQLAGVFTNDITSTLPDTLDPLQFPYHPNRSTDDTIAIALHTALSHLEKRNTYVRMLFIDYSSFIQLFIYLFM